MAGVVGPRFPPVSFVNAYSADFASGYFTAVSGVGGFSDVSQDYPLSIGFWVKEKAGSYGIVEYSGGGTGLGVGMSIRLLSGIIRVQFNSIGTSTRLTVINNVGTNPLTTSSWNNVIVTYDGSGDANGINVYINGVVGKAIIDNQAAYVSFFNSGASTLIGTAPVYGASTGLLTDEVTIINKELSSLEATEYYNLGTVHDLLSTSVSGNITEYYRMEQNSTDEVSATNAVVYGTVTYSTDIPT